MRRIINAAAALCLFSGATAYSQGLSFGAGLSTPNDNISRVYNIQNISNSNFLGSAADLGYHFSVAYKLNLDAGMMFTIGVGLHRFPQGELRFQLENPPPGWTYGNTIVLNNVQNLVPITAGLEIPVYRGFLGFFLVGEVSYVYSKATTETAVGAIPIPLDAISSLGITTDPTTSRIGANLGFGFDLPLGFLTPEITARYNFANLIGAEANEPSRNFVSVTASIFFGSKEATKKKKKRDDDE